MVDVEKIKELVERFARDLDEYLSPTYSEASVRKEFINPLFKALGWDVENEQGLPPNMREVLVEEGETSGAPDYAFRINGQTKFFVEAKKPAESLDNVKHIMQAKSYAWNSKSVFIAGLTDFEGFKLYDASLKPDQHAPERGLIWDLRFEDYLDNLDKLAQLSKEEVEAGSLEKLLLRDKESKRLRVPVDQAFLEQLTSWREELAKSYKNHTPDLDVYTLNEVVQRLLDRLVFIRICEDRRIIPARSLEELVRYWKQEGKRRDLMQAHLAPFFHKQNERFNGEILLPHSCEIYPLDSDLLAGIIENLYFPASPYQFNIIGVEILGTIYERYLGKTLHVTAKRARLEDKPEVRKAGGVYYTPAYIVDYIVQNTLGKLLEPEELTPESAAKLRILDPACGSGSFLLKAYDTLLDWHVEYYQRQIKEGKAKQTRMVGGRDLPYFYDVDGKLELTAAEKARILQNNIFGVDIDPQAVEITMMSLYIKLLEGEVHFPTHRQILPQLKRNIRCGNSLVGPDFYNQQGTQGHLFDAEETRRINAFDWTSKEHGFGEIMAQGGFDVVIGNPPYRMLQPHNTERDVLNYLREKFVNAEFKIELFHLFLQHGISLLKEGGYHGYIVPTTILNNVYAEILRTWIMDKCCIKSISVARDKVFANADVHTSVVIFRREKDFRKRSTNVILTTEKLNEWFVKNPAPFSRVNQKRFSKLPGRVWNILINEDNAPLVTRLTQDFSSLKSLATINRGLITGARAKYFSDKRKSEKYIPIIAGADVHRYFTNPPSEYVLFERPASAGGCWDPEVHKAQHKIVVRQIGYRPTASILMKPIAVTGNIFTVRAGNLEDELYLLGIINSKVIQMFWKTIFTDFKTSFPQVTIFSLSQLPIRTIDFNNKEEKAMHDRMVELVERMLVLNKELHEMEDRLSSLSGHPERVSSTKRVSSTAHEALRRRIDYTDSEIDKLVFKLYNLTEEEIRIVESSI